MPNEEDAPQDAESRESNHDVNHAGGIEMARRSEVRVDGQGSAVEKNKENGTSEPGHLSAKEDDGFFAMCGREPVGFVGKIEAFGRLAGENAGSDKSDEDRQAKNDEHKKEKSLFGLITVGGPVGGEMRGHDLRKLRVDAGPLEQAESQHHNEKEFGKTRVVHGGCP